MQKMRSIRSVRWLLLALLLLCMPAASHAQVAVAISIAPPALPVYVQPVCPGDGYIWTPGYWAWSDDDGDYYWVPGTWIEAPTPGFLWTPGYWGWNNGVYAWNGGYWGPHIGFYGGINYGFGYGGLGYQGGYWNGGQFFYNRSVTNVNVTVIHNVYNRTVIVNNVNRVSFNGGNGGIQVRPRLAELAALREPHAPPMQSQVQMMRAASQNHAQFAAVNHGRPASFVETRAVVADRNVHPAVMRTLRNVPEAARPALEAARREPAPEANRPEQPGAPPRPEAARPEPNRPESARPEPHPAPTRPEVRPEERRAEPAHSQEAHPALEHHPAPAEHKAPERKPESEHPQM